VNEISPFVVACCCSSEEAEKVKAQMWSGIEVSRLSGTYVVVLASKHETESSSLSHVLCLVYLFVFPAGIACGNLFF